MTIYNSMAITIAMFVPFMCYGIMSIALCTWRKAGSTERKGYARGYKEAYQKAYDDGWQDALNE